MRSILGMTSDDNVIRNPPASGSLLMTNAAEREERGRFYRREANAKHFWECFPTKCRRTGGEGAIP